MTTRGTEILSAADVAPSLGPSLAQDGAGNLDDRILGILLSVGRNDYSTKPPRIRAWERTGNLWAWCPFFVHVDDLLDPS